MSVPSRTERTVDGVAARGNGAASAGGPARHALVVGAHGVVGRAIVTALRAAGGWRVVGIARRADPAESDGTVDYRSVDIADARACRAGLGDLAELTHVFYAARDDAGDAATQVARNRAMLAHVVDAIEPVAGTLEHVHLMHGMKAYGNLLGPFKTPAEEDDPRILAPVPYDAQEDFIRARSAGRRWRWSALRPGGICSRTLGQASGLVQMLGVYGSLCRATRRPLWYPGTAAGFAALRQLCNDDLLARAALWVATRPDCADRVFNVHNGDTFRWQHLWPALAAFFDVPAAGPQPLRLRDVMPGLAAEWQALADRHDLALRDFGQVSWQYADVFHNGWDAFANANRLRASGFAESADTARSLLAQLQALRDDRMIP